MKTGHRTVLVWSRSDRSMPSVTPGLIETALHQGGLNALNEWKESLDGLRVAYVDGTRDDLWWEFSLATSFEWQAQIHRMSPESYEKRLKALTEGLEISNLLTVPVSELKPEQRALADLGVALLPRPHLLMWDEPFARLSGRPARLAADMVRVLTAVEGLTAILLSADPDTLEGDWHHDGKHPTQPLDRRNRPRLGGLGRYLTPSRTLWT